LQMVISCSFKYLANSFVVIICGIINSSRSPLRLSRQLLRFLYLCIIFKTYKVNKKQLIVNKNILSLCI
jgi:hypothetical protein